MNNIICTLLSPTCTCILCLILPTDGVEQKLVTRSMAIYQELEVWRFICSAKEIQFNIAAVLGMLPGYVYCCPSFFKTHLVSLVKLSNRKKDNRNHLSYIVVHFMVALMPVSLSTFNAVSNYYVGWGGKGQSLDSLIDTPYLTFFFFLPIGVRETCHTTFLVSCTQLFLSWILETCI